MKKIILIFFLLILYSSDAYSQKYLDLLNEAKKIDSTDIKKINYFLERLNKVLEIEIEYVQKCNNEMRLFSKSRTTFCDEFRKRLKEGYIDNMSLIMFNENLSKAILDAAKKQDELNKNKRKEADILEAKKLLSNVTLNNSYIEKFNVQFSEYNLRNQ